MSVGHRVGEVKTKEELYLILGEADTSKLYGRPVKLDTSHDIPYGGGTSVDGKTVYIDRVLYDEIMAGKVEVRGMTARQIVAAFIEHEHTERSVILGDNPADFYLAAHGMATAKEHEFVDGLLGKGRAKSVYEPSILPALERCVRRDPVNPPKDLWCGPYLDGPDARDRVLLRIFCGKGVTDADKLSKADPTVMYGMAGRNCEDCKHFEYPGKDVSPCEIVCGLVRWNRQCARYAERKGA